MLTLLRKTILNSSPSKSRFLRIKSPINTFCSSESSSEKLERVVDNLQAHGYTDAVKTLAPRINFFGSIGISTTQIPDYLLSNLELLKADLQAQLVPSFDYIKFLVMSDEDALLFVNRYPELLVKKADEVLLFLTYSVGVSNSRTQYVWTAYFTKLKTKLREAVSKESDQRRRKTLYDIIGNPSFDRAWGAYLNWRLSEDDIQMAFFSNPSIMKFPEKRVYRLMDLFVCRMGFEAGRIARSPVVLSYSLENRIVPRSRVIQVLKSKRILKNGIGVTAFLALSDTMFLEKYVYNYEDIVPGLLSIYEGNMDEFCRQF